MTSIDGPAGSTGQILEPLCLYKPDGYKRRSAMEQNVIRFCEEQLDGGAVPIEVAHECVVREKDRLSATGILGSVTIGEVMVTGTWVGGGVALREFHIIARGRKVPSLTVSQQYPAP